MTGTRFCDSCGLSALVRAHKQMLAEGGGLRLVIPDSGSVCRVFGLTGLGRFIPRFTSLPGALPQRPAGPVRPSEPCPPDRARLPRDSAARTGSYEEARAGYLPADNSSVPTRHMRQSGIT
jgi:STAS domain